MTEWNQENRKRFEDLWRRGVPIKDIAKVFRTRPSRVTNIASEMRANGYDLPYRGTRQTTSKRKRVFDLIIEMTGRSEEATVKSIYLKTGFRMQTIRNAVAVLRSEGAIAKGGMCRDGGAWYFTPADAPESLRKKDVQSLSRVCLSCQRSFDAETRYIRLCPECRRNSWQQDYNLAI